MVTFSFNLMATVCVIAYYYFIDQNDIIVHYNIFPNVGVYHTTFPNLKGPKAPSRNCKKIPACSELLSIDQDFCENLNLLNKTIHMT